MAENGNYVWEQESENYPNFIGMLGQIIPPTRRLNIPTKFHKTPILYTAAYKKTVNIKVKVKKISNEKLQPHMNKHNSMSQTCLKSG